VSELELVLTQLVMVEELRPDEIGRMARKFTVVELEPGQRHGDVTRAYAWSSSCAATWMSRSSRITAHLAFSDERRAIPRLRELLTRRGGHRAEVARTLAAFGDEDAAKVLDRIEREAERI